MNSIWRVAFLSLFACAVPACTQQPVDAGAPARVTGTATYKERVALPPNAVFEATLEDVSKADAKSEVLGRARIENPGDPPIAFEIAYDPARIEPRRRYVVRARVLVGDRLFFTTDQAYPALTGGQGSEVALVMRRTSGQVQAPDEPLEGTYWKLILLGDAPVEVAEKQREAHFTLHPSDKRVSGSGGCNRLAGSYQVEGDRLTFGKIAATMMACPQGMETERSFLAALQKVSRAKIAQQQLELLDSSGSVVARFEAVHLR
jgi:putative lipoprotein